VVLVSREEASRSAQKLLAEDPQLLVWVLRPVEIQSALAADGPQLAAALVACGDSPRRLPFVALDGRLAEAAEREGFLTIVPGA
jgi:hypothetical protein